jgi:RAC serine/threonine-protein kinase
VRTLLANLLCGLAVHGQIAPPFRPQVTSETDTRYFDQLFTGEAVNLTPPTTVQQPTMEAVAAAEEEEMESLPYFEQFSYHGSKQSLASSRLSGMSFETTWSA